MLGKNVSLAAPTILPVKRRQIHIGRREGGIGRHRGQDDRQKEDAHPYG